MWPPPAARVGQLLHLLLVSVSCSTCSSTCSTCVGQLPSQSPLCPSAPVGAHCREEGLSFKHVVTFNLDEYFGMHPDALQASAAAGLGHESIHAGFAALLYAVWWPALYRPGTAPTP